MENTFSIRAILLLLFFSTASGICQTPDSGEQYTAQSSAAIHGAFIDAEDGHPIADVLARVASEKIERVYPDREFTHETATDAEGAFSLNIPNKPQTYYAFSLMALHPQYQAKLLRQEMAPGKSRYDLGEIKLKRTLSLQGNVSGGKNVAELVVNLKMHTKPANFFRAAAPIEHAIETDTEGNFRFSELYPIEYTLTISRDGIIIGFMEAIHPQKQAQISVYLPKLETLRATVVDAQGHPIADAQIYATRHRETPSGHGALLTAAQTDETGRFQMQVLETEARLLSLEISKKGYFATIYENVDIGKMPPIISLEKGITITGHVSLPRDIPSDAHYTLKVFPAYTQMEPNLNPLALHKPLLSTHFPVTESTFVVDGLSAEKYILYLVGDGLSATRIDVDAPTNAEEVLIVAERPGMTLEGQILWADTGEPVRNAIVSRSWYPWELHPYDVSMTLDRFETETDAQGNFKFCNLTEARYQLHIRAIHAELENAMDVLSGLQTPPTTYQRTLVHKLVDIPACGTAYYIYLGQRDGTPFVPVSTEN